MAVRIIKSFPKTGSVSRQKIRAAVKRLGKAPGGPNHRGKALVTNRTTASGSKRIAFRKVSFGPGAG